MPPLPSVASADRAGRPYSHEYYVLHVIMITMMVIAVLFTRAGAERDREYHYTCTMQLGALVSPEY